ncbi:MAG: response regulator transcription factor [Bryobacteraceae bacterium]|nr:response regulator transcription factor [Bryobacteraceae bacterium]
MTAGGRHAVLLADEQTMWREAAVWACEASGRFQVTGQCADGPEVLRLADRVRPDVVVLDHALPGLDPLEITRRLLEAAHRPRVVLVSMVRDRQAVLDALHCGASGYLLKSDTLQCLLDALGAVLGGSIYLSPQIDPASVFSPPKPSQRRRRYDQLGLRERQVFNMVVAGLRTKDIAQRLELSPKTVSTHRVKMMAKLGIPDLAGLIRYAIRNRLLPP